MKKIISLCLVFALAGSVAFAEKTKRSWNFSSWSQETLTLLETASGWKWNGSDRYELSAEVAVGETVYMTTDRTATGTPFQEFVGLNLSVQGSKLSAKNFGIVTTSTSTPPNLRLRVGKPDLKFSIPACTAGDIVVVICASANSTSERGITAVNATRLRGGNATGAAGRIVNEFKVDADGDVVLAATDGIELYSITVNPKLAYVTTATGGASTDAGDQAIVDILRNTYIVDYIDAAATGVDYSGYDAVVLAALPGSGGAGLPALEGLAKPFVNLKAYQMQASRWNWGVPDNLKGAGGVIKVSQKEHPIFTGITFAGENADEVTLATASTHAEGRILINMVYNENIAYKSAAISRDWTANTAPVISELPAGTVIPKTAGDITLAYKTMVIGVSETANAALTADYLTIVKNAVDYVLDPKSYVYPTEPGNGTEKIETEGKVVVRTEYYNVSGMKLERMAPGINIVKEIYEDGSSKATKLFLRD